MKSKFTARDAEAWLDFYGVGKGLPLGVRLQLIRDTHWRCGVADRVQEAGRRCQWPEKRVSYYVDPEVYDAIPAFSMALTPALKSWEKVCGIRFVESKQTNANIRMQAGRIDGLNGTLAWSYLPCGFAMDDQALQRYDTGDVRGVFDAALTCQEVIAHEVGHAIGLSHLSTGNLMQPFASGRIIVPQKGDIAEVVARYGKSPSKPPEEPDEPPAQPPAMDWSKVDWSKAKI